ncbi:class I adenylate-forming enzyme family protein [Labedaea rhizosphaerae]|uniref:Acyl-CoA synthetase (AMP-forming)/AMP-acid ligase II n=1 Tax=Labedaea rhizosphaerae TaxID=598644 RepID=A0A4R6S909_LABRH|nr:AMP-binding protein [Labedaea rhizosphaerae]TDP96489.1 acyl-CoA synthetase (AMP-forming)/AMP-acid ligase II [Labedaea rhizosphaerae]
MSETVYDLLAAARTTRADHTALIDPTGSFNYAELGAVVDRATSWLHAKGVGDGERIVYAGEGDHRFVALFFAALRLGAVFVPVHPGLTPSQIDYIAGDCAAKLVLAQSEVDGAWAEVLATPSSPVPHVSPDPDAVALLIYTSGTTGTPKGVVCPHRQVVAAARAINARLGYRADDVVLCRLPLSFDYGLYQVLLTVLAGGTLVLTEGRAADGLLLRTVVKHGVTVLPVVPSLARMLLTLQRRYRETTKLRLFTNTGARLGRDIGSALLELFPGARYASMYGITECKRVSILDPEDYERHPDSVGLPIPGATVRIVGPDGEDLPAGDIGEIVVSGATVMAGYWGVPLSEQRAYVRRADGSLELHTGDQGYLDDAGRLYFVGRDDAIIKRRGIRISLVEVENAAEQLDGVAAAVALKPDTEDGQFRLAVQLDGALTETEVRDALAVRLDAARLPDRVFRIDSVPLTRNGKPDAKAIAALLDETTDRPGSAAA